MVKELARCRQGHLISGADRDDTGDQLLEGRLEATFGQLKQGCLRIGPNRVLDALHGKVNVKGKFVHYFVISLF
jgi:hypothetical protein